MELTEKYPFRKVYSEQALAFMELGHGRTDVAKEFRVPLAALDAWMEVQEVFKDAIILGETLCYSWWLSEGRSGIHDKGFNTAAWMMQMKNRFGWADKQEIKKKIDINGTIKTFCVNTPKERGQVLPTKRIKIVD